MKSLASEIRALWNGRSLLAVMVARDLRMRHAGSALGALWLYAQPLLTIGAYFLVFDVVFNLRLGEGAPTRAMGTYLVVGIVPWLAFSDAVGRGMMSLVEAGALLQKNPMPPVLFPVRAALASAVVFLPMMAVLVPLYAPHHGFGPALLLLLPLLVLALLGWCLLSYVLAILAAALRDVTQLVTFVLGVGMFVSPVLFPISMFPQSLAWLLWLNPMTPTVLGVQSILLQGAVPGPGIWLALLLWLLLLAVVLDRLVARSREQLIDWL
jgi:lipopolysaccharide transport system permease protein